MRADCAFEAMENENVRYILRAVAGSVEPMNFQEIIVWRFPAFDSSWYRLLAPDQLSPKRLRMTARYPPGGVITSGKVGHAC